MARPFEKPLVTAGKFTYFRLGSNLYVVPADCFKGDEEQLIAAINFALDRNKVQILTGEQHRALMRLLEHHVITTFRR